MQVRLRPKCERLHLPQREFPSILRYIPARFPNFSILRAVFVENGVGIVDVHKDLVRPAQFCQTLEAASRAGNWQVAHLEGAAAAPLHPEQLVIRPEGPIKQH